jgi:Tfp pilus assembly protein PilO
MNLQTMAPSAKRSLLVTLIFGAVAAGLYFGVIEQTESKLIQVRKEVTQHTERNRKVAANLSRSEDVKKQVAEAESKLEKFRAAMIKPLLESTAMRAKSYVETLAVGCGLSGMVYESLAPIKLPVVKTIPQKKYVRCPIRMTCVGSYQKAVSFVRCLEKDFPLVAVSSITITSRSEANAQQVAIVLEWPMESPENSVGGTSR